MSLVSVVLGREHQRDGAWFVAKGHVRTAERVVFASVSAADWQQSVSFLIDNLDRIVMQ